MIVLKNIKKMSKIPTVEEFYKQTTGCTINHGDVKTAMIEFAKLHVEAALKEAKWRCDDVTNSEGLGLYVENSYPLENIK